MDHRIEIESLLAQPDGHDIWYGVGSHGNTGYKCVAVQEVDSGRWSRTNMHVLIDPAGGLWGFNHEEGLTEYQDYGDEDQDNTVFKVMAVPSVTYEAVS